MMDITIRQESRNAALLAHNSNNQPKQTSDHAFSQITLLSTKGDHEFLEAIEGLDVEDISPGHLFSDKIKSRIDINSAAARCCSLKIHESSEIQKAVSRTEATNFEKTAAIISQNDVRIEIVSNLQTQATQDNVSEISPTPNQQITATDNNINYSDEKFLIRENTCLALIITVLCITALLIIHRQFSLDCAFYTFYTCLIIFIAEKGYRSSVSFPNTWRRREEILDILHKIALLVFIISLHLKLTLTIQRVSVSYIPMLFSLIMYISTSRAPASKRFERAGLYTIYSIQAILISLYMDEVLRYGWIYAILLSWIYLGRLTIHFFGFTIITLFLFIEWICKAARRQTFTRIDDLVGLVWNTSYYSFGTIAIFTTWPLMASHDKAAIVLTLEKASVITLTAAALLIFVSLSYNEQLVRFLYCLNHQTPGTEEGWIDYQKGDAIHTIKLHTEIKNSYFVRLSSTYFLPLQNSFLRRDKLSLLRIKDLLSQLGLSKGSHSAQHPRQGKGRNLSSTETLKGCKTTLDSKLKRRRIIRKLVESSREPNLNNKDRGCNNSYEVDNRVNIDVDLEKLAVKPQFSLNDVDSIEMPHVDQSSSIDNNCYICYSQEANALFMDCGHAGVCYECAITLFKKDGSCMECRSKIVAVHKIDSKPKFSNIVRGFEVGFMTNC